MGTLLLQLLLAIAPPESIIWQGVSGGYQVVWTADDIRALKGASPVWSLRRQWEARLRASVECEDDVSFEIVSLVGTILTVRVEHYWNCPMTAHPGTTNDFQTIDLRQPATPVALTRWFSDSDLYRALITDKLVRSSLTDVFPGNLKVLVDTLSVWSGECAYRFPPDFLNHFAFHHLQNGQVAVRIGLPYGCEVERGRLTQLGLALPAPQALRGPLLAADRRKAGWLMQDQAAIARGRVGRITKPAQPPF